MDPCLPSVPVAQLVHPFRHVDGGHARVPFRDTPLVRPLSSWPETVAAKTARRVGHGTLVGIGIIPRLPLRSLDGARITGAVPGSSPEANQPLNSRLLKPA